MNYGINACMGGTYPGQLETILNFRDLCSSGVCNCYLGNFVKEV